MRERESTRDGNGLLLFWSEEGKIGSLELTVLITRQSNEMRLEQWGGERFKSKLRYILIM